jgi:hypothetical protein
MGKSKPFLIVLLSFISKKLILIQHDQYSEQFSMEAIGELCCWERVLACYLLHAGFLLGFLIDSEDGGNIFLRNAGCLSTDYRALYPKKIEFFKSTFRSRDFLFIITEVVLRMHSFLPVIFDAPTAIRRLIYPMIAYIIQELLTAFHAGLEQLYLS